VELGRWQVTSQFYYWPPAICYLRFFAKTAVYRYNFPMQLEVSRTPGPQRPLTAVFAEARRDLADAEAALAKEQAAVNAFRMQCRLKIGQQVDTLLDLRAEKQMVLTRLALWQQAEDEGTTFDATAFFGADCAEEADGSDNPLLPELALETDATLDKAAEKRLYRELARRFHPDLGAGSAERAYRTAIMAAVNNAYSNHDIQGLRDLAGELDPTAVAELNLTNDGQETRKLREQILACQRRQRKVVQQLKALRQENISRLWRRAQQLEEAGQSWWEEIRRELEAAITATKTELTQLKVTLETVQIEIGD
jgi:hypothetical protein